MKEVFGFDVKPGDKKVDLVISSDPEEALRWEALYAGALAGQSEQFVKEVRKKDGAKLFLHFSINPIRENDSVIGLSCFMRDITRQKMDEMAVKKSEASLRTILENTDMSYVLIDGDLKILSFNALAQKFSGDQGRAISEGDSVFDYFTPEKQPFIADILSRAKNGETVNYQMSTQNESRARWFDITWVGIKNLDHENLGYLLTNKDITERKKSELENERITTDLIQRNKALEQFSYIISHNLRAPLANIMGLSSLLNSVEYENDPLDLNIISGTTESAKKLSDVILDLNQILQVNSYVNEQNKLVSLPELIEDIKISIGNLIEKESVMITCDFAGADSMFTLKSYLHSIFYNLILNSIKYHRAEITPVISIRADVVGDKINIIYKDNGRGIDTVKNAKNLFGLYKRFDTSVEGKGMGLFMVKMQVESLGGTISLKSQLNQGVKFKLEFPLEQVPESLVEHSI
jgi:PAS domain S-box-containing protein